MESIRIAASEADSVAASEIYAASWKTAYRGLISDEFLGKVQADWWIDKFNSNYHTRRFEVALLSVDGLDIAAGACGKSRNYDDGDWGEITSLYMLPAYWRHGYGAKLMAFLLARLREQGFKQVHLWVLRDNLRARAFYEKQGFAVTGRVLDEMLDDDLTTDVEYARVL